MGPLVQAFYASVKSKIAKDSDLPNFFAYYLTVQLDNPAATVSQVKKCYDDCDLHPPSWLASHFSTGLRSKPRRFVKKDRGYRLEGQLRERISALIGSEKTSSDVNSINDGELAGIEYGGIAGGSKDCQDVVVMLLQSSTTLADLAEGGLRAASHSVCIVGVEAARRGRGWLV